MSSEYNAGATLLAVRENLFKFGGPIIICIGTVSCILNLLVFTKKTLRKNACAMYLIAFNVSNILLIYASVFQATLSTGYGISPSSQNLICCRLGLYTSFLFDSLSSSFLILASIDRVLVTSRNALTRQRSTRRLTSICIISITIFWILCHSHALILPVILELLPMYLVCYFPSGLYLALVGYYSVIVKGIVMPLLMIIPGLLTLRNIRSIRRVTIVPSIQGTGATSVHGGLNSTQSKDRQLIRILLMDVSIHIIFNVTISVALMYQQVAEHRTIGLFEAQVITLLLGIGAFTNYIPYCIGFYVNMLVSKTFRNEAKSMFVRQ